MISASGYSAFRLVIGSNLADLYRWDDQDEDLLFAQRRKLRIMAQELHCRKRKTANYDAFNCAGVEIGASVLFFKALNRKSQPKWSGPQCILEIDGTGATAQYQSQTFKVAKYCARREVDEKEAGGTEGPPDLGLGGDRYRTEVLGPECKPLSEGGARESLRNRWLRNKKR